MQRLAEIRKAKGFTQDQLALAVGISRYSIIDYEKCRISPTIEVAEKIATVLNSSLLELNPPQPSAQQPEEPGAEAECKKTA